MVVIEVETYEDFKNHIFGEIVEQSEEQVEPVEPKEQEVPEKSKEVEAETVHNKKYIFVDFYAPWCGPCRRFAPTLEELSETYSKSIHFIKVDITEVEECQEEYDIIKLPTFLIFDRGNLETSYQPIIGTNRETIENRLKQLTEETKIDDDF